MNPILKFIKGLAPPLASPKTGGSGYNLWHRMGGDSFTGSWQMNRDNLSREDLTQNHAIFSCVSLISQDIAKLPVKLTRKVGDIWEEVSSPAFGPVLRRPNKFMNRIQFFENWNHSVLLHGNCYILKRRDLRGVVTQLYILNPERVKPLVSESGDVFYELQPDNLATVKETIIVPASEILHDRTSTIFHPLIGLSPLYAAAIPVLQARSIQESTTQFFQNNARPGGVLTAPGAVSDETVEQLRTYWESNYTGNLAGRVAVLADGLQYSSFEQTNNANAEVMAQLKWSAEIVCSLYHIPPYKIGLHEAPRALNVEALNLEYYSQALQTRIEAMELVLSEGLNLPDDMSVEFDIDNLLRMDSATQMQVLKDSAGILSPNEQRAKVGKKPVVGGFSPMVQQQNYSLQALAKRDAKANPFSPDDPPAEKTLLIKDLGGLPVTALTNEEILRTMESLAHG